jgi:L-threonate 2-dehydrogenase
MTPQIQRVGIIGLGIMGGIMAKALMRCGYEVFGYDISSSARTRLRKEGGRALASSADVARQADILITSLPTSAALHACVAELAQETRRGQILIETSTLPLIDKKASAKALRQQGRRIVDAPISGTATASPQDMWIMYCSGTAADCRAAATVAKAFALQAPRVGAFGAGIQLKIAANHLVAIYNVAYAEIVTLCRKMGLPPETVLAHMGHSPYIGTGAMRLRMPMMIARSYEPATMKMVLWQKDMQIITETAREVGSPTPLLDACHAIYDQAILQGLGDADTAVCAEVLMQMNAKRPAKKLHARQR